MKTLDRYLIRELIVPFLIGTLAVVLMFVANLLIAVFKDLSVQHVPMLAVVQLLLFEVPKFLNMTLPVGMSLAASLAFTRLQRESELTAMRSAGSSLMRTIRPVAIFGLLVGVGNYLIAEKVEPVSEKAFRSTASKVGVLATIPPFTANAMIKLRNFTVSIGTVTREGADKILLQNILLVERPNKDETTLVIADSGQYKDGVWTLHDAYLRAFKGDDIITARPRKDVVINEKIVLQDLFLPPEPEGQTAEELRVAIANARKLGGNVSELATAYHVRFSVPASCLVFAIVAPIFSILFARSGGFAGVLVSIFLVFLYYNVFIISTQILGRDGVIPPIAAAWLPNVLFVVMGVFGLRRLE